MDIFWTVRLHALWWLTTKRSAAIGGVAHASVARLIISATHQQRLSASRWSRWRTSSSDRTTGCGFGRRGVSHGALDRAMRQKGFVGSHLGSTSTQRAAAPGRNSRKSPSCFAVSSTDMKLIAVTLPPGRLRLATRPSLTGSPRADRESDQISWRPISISGTTKMKSLHVLY